MITETITYKNFDGEMETETLYFNLSRTKLIKNLWLKNQFEEVQTMLLGVKRELTMDEVQMVLTLVETVMRLAYGERPDAKHFDQSDAIWERFTQTKAYDEFTYSLFENPEKANNFLFAVFPAELMAGVEEQLQNGPIPDQETPLELPTAPPVLAAPDEEDTRPAWVRENREPTNKELQTMTPDQLRDAMRVKMQGGN